MDKIFRIFFIRMMFESDFRLRKVFLIHRAIRGTGTKRSLICRSWNVTVALFRNTSEPFYKLNRDESDGSRIKSLGGWFTAGRDSIPISIPLTSISPCLDFTSVVQRMELVLETN